MRAFSNIARAIDSKGMPINGKIYFYVNGTSTLAGIKDSTGTNITNPQPLVSGKPRTQVFLPDQDIKYVITKNDDTEIENGVDKYLTFNVSTAGVNVTTFQTMNALKNSTGYQVDSVCQLLGYSSAGDKPVITYTLKASLPSGVSTDDGAYVQNLDGNYWIMSEPEIIDARHWGVFPYDSTAQAHTHANMSQITSANAYAEAHSKVLELKEGYYEFGGGSYTTTNGTVFGATGSSITLHTENTKVYAGGSSYNATFVVIGDKIKQSQLLSDNVTISTRRYIVDTNKIVSVSNCEVVIENNLTYSPAWPITWTNVNVSANHRIGTDKLYIASSFINPSIYDDSLQASYFVTHCVNCRSDSSLWTDSQKWSVFAGANRSDHIVNNATVTGTANVDTIVSQDASIDELTVNESANVCGLQVTSGNITGDTAFAGEITFNGITKLLGSTTRITTANIGTAGITSASIDKIKLNEVHVVNGSVSVPDQYLMSRTSSTGDVLLLVTGTSNRTITIGPNIDVTLDPNTVHMYAYYLYRWFEI